MKLLSSWLAPERDLALSGERVRLRPAGIDDFHSWAALRQQSRAFLEPWEPKWEDQELTRAAFRERIRRINQLWEEDSTYSFLIFSDASVLLGGINLSNVRRGVAQTGSLGYWIGEPFRRQGYMRDALQAITNYAFLDLGLHRLEAACLPHNQASINLLRACQFKPEGLARDYLRIAGKWEDHLLFAKLASDK
jgi:[ribosomal protein S5]-alanine N-acetyltransferase